MKLFTKYGTLSKTRVVGTMLLAAFSLFVAGCGDSNDNTAAMAANAAAQQQKIAAANTSIIQMSAGKMLFGSSTWGNVVGASMVKNSFSSYSSVYGKSQSQSVNRYSVDTGGRLIKQKAVFGTSSSATAFSYDGATTAVKEISVSGMQLAYTYDSSGRISGYTRSYGTPPTVDSTTIVYDSSGRTETTISGAATYTYVYDTHNYELSFTNGTWSTRNVPTYDASGNLTAEKQYYKASATATEVLASEITSTYGPNGVLTTTKINYDYSSGALTGTIVTTNTYGSNGKVAQTSEVNKNATGNLLQTTIKTYTYDASGNKLTENSVNTDSLGLVYNIYNTSRTYITLLSGKDDQ